MKIEDLYQVILNRKKQMPKNSYIADLIRSGSDQVIQKIGEEATEVIIAAKNKSKQRLVSESADLWFHLLVLFVDKDVSLEDIYNELEKRRKEK
ncbi:phosphoribosyl-ATP diphosphatase [Candidatus Microgenomates bacterium]|nr:MAG: phosphoribosyl-ATP diphosphatase [Candidatus Microgenomates bacterium]